MTINWYDFFHKIRTISGILVVFDLLWLPIIIIPDNMFDTTGYVPSLIIKFIVFIFSWFMLRKFKLLKNVPDVSTKKTRRLYSVIGISLMLAFVLLYLLLVKTHQP